MSTPTATACSTRAKRSLAGVSIALTGTDDLGDVVNLTTTTDSSDPYLFSGLRPGTYTLTATPLMGYVAGTATVGSQVSGTVASSSLSAIALTSGTVGTGNDFSSLLASQVVSTVDLSGDFNLTGITANGADFTGGLDGVRQCPVGQFAGHEPGLELASTLPSAPPARTM